MKITNIEIEDYDGPVYDLSVSENHNFLANGFLVHNCGKKKYVYRAESSEGVVFKEPKFKVKGLEMVRSSTPAFVRKKLKNALNVIFDGTESEAQQYIAEARDEFMKLRYQEVSFPRSANNLSNYASSASIYEKGNGVSTPIQVRGSLLYNHWLQKHNLVGKFPVINSGDKIKFVYLNTPNRIHEDVIAFPADGEIPSEFGIVEKVNYDLQFEKTMLASMDIILKAIGWKPVPESSATLDEFFWCGNY